MRSLVAFLVLSLVQWAPWLLAGWFPGGDSGRDAAAVVGAGLFALAVVWFDRVVLGPRGRRLGLDADPSLRARVLGGLGVGLLVYGAVFLARAAIGAVTVDGSREVVVVVGVLANGLVVAGYQAVSEEIVFRGALLGVLPRSVRPATAVALSVAVFVAYHLPKWEDLLHGPYALHLVLAGTAFAMSTCAPVRCGWASACTGDGTSVRTSCWRPSSRSSR